MNQTCFKALFLLAMVGLILLSGCSTVRYSVMENFGKEKRHLLVSDVEKVQKSQAMAQDEFTDVLARIKELYAYEGGNLEIFYANLKGSTEQCEARAVDIEKRINQVEQVAWDLFAEWESEIDQINDPKLKGNSRQSLVEARSRYKRMEIVMHKSSQGMYPVLAKLKDYTLYLKHNLNAKAVGSLGNELVSIEQEVTALVEDMNHSIREADNFIKTF